MSACFLSPGPLITWTANALYGMTSATSPLFSQFQARRPFALSLSMSLGTGAEPAQIDAVAAPVGKAAVETEEAFDFSDSVFSNAVSGEWLGYECSFSVRDGVPRNVPDRYIPDEYRHWGVEVKGFESLTSSSCLEGSLLVKHTRALPSVGCEADAVVPEVIEHTYSSKQNAAVNGGFPDGTISCGPATMTDDHAQRWKVSLADPREGVKSRIRAEFGLVNEPFGAVTLYLEHWDAPFCNGEVLPGCGGKNESFATDSPLDPTTELSGTWSVESILYTTEGDRWRMENGSAVVERSADMAAFEVNVALPKGVSVGITSSDDGSKCVTTGWLVQEGLRVLCRRRYNCDGTISSVSRDVEKKIC